MNKPTLTMIILLAGLISLPAHATLSIMACEPEWASLATELGGDKVKVSSATTARQDPHRIEARPSLIARTRNADLLVCTGLELEAGWLPILIQQSGNSRIARGQIGFFEAGSVVQRLEVPTHVDRNDGDVHAAGNPHIQQDPRNIALIATELSKRLSEVDPSGATYYQARLNDFSVRWTAAMQRWSKQTAPLKNMAVIEHHRNMEYLMNWLGMRQVGTLEPKPGVEPSAAHLSQLLTQLQRQPARMILRAAYQDDRASQWLSERAHIPAVELPFTVGGNDQARDLFGLFDDTVQRLLEATK
ncbi:MAG: zinc ABC transporter substrate-binding protein [Betaproteobacteria bacterium]